MSEMRSVEELFEAALALAPSERAEFLRTRDLPLEVRREVESLLSHHERSSAFLETPAASFAAPRVRPEWIGPFRILREIGAGGMGVVYLAEQAHPRREVALKILRPGFASPRALRRFEHEAAALARLQHPGVAGIYEAGAADWGSGPQPYFAMEHVRGPHVLEHAASRGLGVRARLSLLADACDAVAHAHSRGVVHRDLKPSNLLVDEAVEPAQVKVLDFGVARVTDCDTHVTSLRTDVGQVLGTVAYMSPEQAAGDPDALDERTDVYSLGVIGYELLCGRLPLDVVGRPLHGALRALREDEPTPISRVAPALRGDIETIFARALEKDRARRYSSAAALAADLRRFLADRPIEARPASRWYVATKFARRNRALVGGALAVVAALGIGLAGTGWQAVEASRARDRATSEAETASGERDRADLEARRAKAVLRFQQDMLARVRPQSGGRSVKLADVLDAAAASLPGELAGDPSSEASVRETLGVSYQALGLLPPAREQFERAIELLVGAHGAHSVQAFTAQSRLAQVLAGQGESARARELAQRSYEGLRALAGPGSESTLIAELEYASALDRAGEVEQALELSVENLARRRAEFGERHALTGAALAAHGNFLWRRGRLKEAEPYLREALEIGLEIEGERHPTSLTRRSLLANCLRQLGQPEPAEELYREALAIGIEVLGAEHLDTLTWKNNLAGVLQDRGQLDEAEELLREVVDTRVRTLGAGHEDTLIARNNLALLLSTRGRHADAEALHRETLESKLAQFGVDHRSTLLSVHNLALALLFQERLDEALPLFRDCAERAPAALPAGHYQIASYRESLGACLLRMKRHEEAECELLAALESMSASVPEGDQRVTTIALRLFKLYTEVGASAKAEAIRTRFTPER
jgi:tetratricopeptide (TPR) repeat protein